MRSHHLGKGRGVTSLESLEQGVGQRHGFTGRYGPDGGAGEQYFFP
jgi:hypothetical protein